MVPSESASSPSFGGREAGGTDNGHDEYDSKEFEHEIPSSIYLTL
jgi:hypothetical protein